MYSYVFIPAHDNHCVTIPSSAGVAAHALTCLCPTTA